MTVQIVEQIEYFSPGELEILEFLPEELENIESELYPDLENISLEEVARDLEAFFEVGLIKGRCPCKDGLMIFKRGRGFGLEKRSRRSARSRYARRVPVPPEAQDKSPINLVEVDHISYGSSNCNPRTRQGRRQSIHNSLMGGARSVRVFYRHPRKGIRLGPCRKIKKRK